MARGRRVRRDEAAKLLGEWEASGESMSTWCGRRGLNRYSLSAFKGWGIRDELAFVEVVEVQQDTVVEARAVNHARYRIEIGGATIEVGDDFRSETLQRLVRAVAPC